MGQKDIAEKMLADYNDVFADIVNVLLFEGKPVIKEGSLQHAKSRSHYKAETDSLHEQERDIVKYWITGGSTLAICGLENQTSAEKYMPLRIIGYDGASYRQQLLPTNKDKPVIPVITLILYFGEKRWNYPHNLKGVLNIPDALEPYVSDYQTNIFSIAYLDENTVELFQSDFRIVADYFVQKRKKKDYIPNPKVLKHVDEFLKLMKVLTGDSRYDITFTLEEKKGEIRMCDVMEKAENIGIAKGISIGETRQLLNIVDNMTARLSLSLGEVLDMIGITMDDYNNAKKELQ